MDTETQPQEQVNPADKNTNSKRSASYPAYTVLEAYDFALKINEKFSNIEVTRKEIANVLKMHPTTISRELAAVAAYGFAEKISYKGESEIKYKLTQLFTDIFLKESEKQRRVSLLTAFGNPKLYRELINKFDNSLVPHELPNTLIKHHSITENAAKDAADIFVRSGQEVGAISETRVLSYKVSLGAVQKTQYAEIIDETHDAGNDGNSNKPTLPVVIGQGGTPPATDDRKIPIHLTKNKMAYFAYPSDITANDIKIVEYEIKGILLRLQLENEEDENARKENRANNSPE